MSCHSVNGTKVVGGLYSPKQPFMQMKKEKNVVDKLYDQKKSSITTQDST